MLHFIKSGWLIFIVTSFSSGAFLVATGANPNYTGSLNDSAECQSNQLIIIQCPQCELSNNEGRKIYHSAKLFTVPLVGAPMCSLSRHISLHSLLPYIPNTRDLFITNTRFHLVINCFTLLFARHLGNGSCFIRPSMASEFCMEVHNGAETEEETIPLWGNS